MSDEPYDPDGDVGRFLHCPSPETHMFALSEVQGHHQAPQALNAAPDLVGHQVPTNTEFHGHPAPQALGVAPDFSLHAPTTEIFQAHPAAPNFSLPVPAAIDAAEHYQAPIINAGQYQASAMDVDQYHQPMAIDNIQPTTQMAAHEMYHHAYGGGGFPDPTPMLVDGVGEASLFQANTSMPMLANGVVVPYPSPSLSVYQQLINQGEPELAAIIRDIERGNNAGASGSGAALNDVHPIKEEVRFWPFNHGQLDCSRCRTVREVVCLDENRRIHFIVHATGPGMIFEHAIVDRMSIRADGQLHTDVLLHHDLRSRNHMWVHNFIERSVDIMKRNRGQILDTCPSYYGAAASTSVAPPPLPPPSNNGYNGAAASTSFALPPPPPPPLSNHTYMEWLHAYTLSAPAATTAAQPAVMPQEQQTTDAPGVVEAAAPQAAVTLQEQQTNDVPGVVEMMKRNRGQIQDACPSYNGAAASASVATAPPPSNHAHMEQLQAMLHNILSAPAATTGAQPAVTPQAQQTTEAPGVAEAAAPQAAVTDEQTTDVPMVAEAAATQAAVTPQEQGENTDAPGVVEAAEPAITAPQEQETTHALGVAETVVPEAAQPGVAAPQEQENTDAPAEGTEATGHQAVQQPTVSQDAGAIFAPFNWEGFQPDILESSLVPPYDPASGSKVLLYPSLIEQLRQTELERKESKRLSKMPAVDTATYLELSDQDFANEPKLGSLPSFRRLCQRDSTYRLYSRRVNCINRKITKLQKTAARVGPKGLFAIKQKMETYKSEKAGLYDMINKAMEENERGGDNGAGPSNRGEPSNDGAGPSNEAGTSNDAAGPSNTVIPSMDGAGTSNDAAGPSNTAIPSSDGAAGSSDASAGISNDDARPSGSK